MKKVYARKEKKFYVRFFIFMVFTQVFGIGYLLLNNYPLLESDALVYKTKIIDRPSKHVCMINVKFFNGKKEVRRNFDTNQCYCFLKLIQVGDSIPIEYKNDLLFGLTYLNNKKFDDSCK